MNPLAGQFSIARSNLFGNLPRRSVAGPARWMTNSPPNFSVTEHPYFIESNSNPPGRTALAFSEFF
jgi:hypothetical protein